MECFPAPNDMLRSGLSSCLVHKGSVCMLVFLRHKATAGWKQHLAQFLNVGQLVKRVVHPTSWKKKNCPSLIYHKETKL